MVRCRFYSYFAVLFFIFTFLAFSFPQQTLSIEELVEKNIQAAGGKEKISQIRHYSFNAAGRIHYMSSDGKMKITSGKAPIITEIILADRDAVK